MCNLNKVIVAGHLCKDPELKALPSGQNICNFSLATNHSYKNKDGETVETAEFHNIVCFGPTAENSAKYLAKGQICLVEGRLQTRSWDKDGVKHYRTEIMAESVQFGPKGGERKEAEEIGYPEDEINPDDVPF